MTTTTKIVTTSGSFSTGSDPNLRYLLNGTINVAVAGQAGKPDPGIGTPGGGGGVIAGDIPFIATQTLTMTFGYHAGGSGTPPNGTSPGGNGGHSNAALISGTLYLEAGGGGGAGGTANGVSGNGGAGGVNALNGNSAPWFFDPTGAQGGVGGAVANGAGGAGGAAGSGTNGGAGGNAASGVGGGSGGGGIASGLPGAGGGGGGGGAFGGGGGGGGAGGVGFSTEGGGGAGGGGGGSFSSPLVINPIHADGLSGGDGQVQIIYTYADAPKAPTLVAPLNNSFHDATQGITFEFTPNPNIDSGGLNGYVLSIFEVGVDTLPRYYDASLGAFGGGVVVNPCSPTTRSVTVPIATISNGHNYIWSLQTQESHFNRLGPTATSFNFTAVVAPVVTLTAPSGTAPFLVPAISWTDSLGGGLSQTQYRAMVYLASTSLQPDFVPGVTPGVFDTGPVASAATSVTVSPALTNGTDYVAYVQIQETGGIPSLWASSAFTTDLDPPATPLITVLPTSDPITGVPQVKVRTTQLDNRMNAPDTTFLFGPYTWTFTNCTGVQAPVYLTALATGLKEMHLTAGGGGGTISGHTVEKIPCSPGLVVAALGNVESEVTARAFSLQVIFWNVSGGIIATDTVQTATSVVGVFGKDYHGTVAAPAGTVACDIGFSGASTAAGEHHNLTNFGIWIGYDPGVGKWSAGGYQGAATFEVQRSIDQINWADARGSGLSVFTDSETPLNGVIYYRARTIGTLLGGPATSAWSTITAVTVSSRQWWLLDPVNQNPDANGQPWAMPLHRIASQTGTTQSGVGVTLEVNQVEQQGVFSPFGRKNPVVVHGDLYGEEFDLALLFYNTAEWEAFNGLRARQTVLCLRSDMEDQVYYVALGPDRPRDMYGTTDRLSDGGPYSQVVVHCFPADIP